jgi:glycine/D-amino acid oxidase-like deaminating enzyme
MSEKFTGITSVAETAPRRLTFDLDADICVVGAGLAGLTTAIEAARLGASVVVLEGRHIGWGASGCMVGTVMPGYDLAIKDIVARVGFEDAKELWALSKEGAEYVRARTSEPSMPGVAASEGVLEVSNVDAGDRLISKLQMLTEDFETEVEGWQIDRVRAHLKTDRYFHGVYFPKAFQIDGHKYVHGLAALARRAGVRIFEDTPVVSIDASGIRKRIVTPSARLRASHIVLAGNVHLGAPSRRMSDNLLPVWRYAGLTEPLGARLAEAIAFGGAVIDAEGIDHFRIVDGDRLMWASPETTWQARPQRLAAGVARRIRNIFPHLADVQIAQVWGGAIGQTVHGMPQIGQLRKGLWVASGFGGRGLSASATAGQLISRSILFGDDRWRLFSPFELVWAGGVAGRVVGQLIGMWTRGSFTAAGALARYRARLREQEQKREARLAEANRLAGIRPARPRPLAKPPNSARVDTPAADSKRLRRPAVADHPGEGAS